MGGWTIKADGLYKSDNIFINSGGTFSFTPSTGKYCSFVSAGNSEYIFAVKGALASFSKAKGIEIGTTSLTEDDLITMKAVTGAAKFPLTVNGTEITSRTLRDHLVRLY
jgi:hypothetical protein